MSVTDAAFEGLNNRYLDLVIAMEKSQARIAELEARLTLAEKVVEAAEWFSGKIHWSAAHTIGVEFELKTFREALAAWMAQKH